MYGKNIKTIFKVEAYREYIFTGTLDACIKAANKRNKQSNANICAIEVWDKENDCYLTTIDCFWYI